MSGVEAFGLICNVLSVIDFALKTVSVCKNIYRDGQAHPDLVDCGRAFDTACKSLQESLVEDPVLGELSKEEQSLLTMSKKCAELATMLQTELGKLEIRDSKTGKWYQAMSKTVRASWKKGTIDDICDKFKTYQQILQTSILVDLRKRSIANEADHSLDLQRLEDSIENTIAKLEELELKRVNETHYKCVLDSLFFPEMKSRQDQIPDAHKDTFKWIFDRDTAVSKFPEWLEDEASLYWISGKPGSGKSTLMRFIYEDPRTQEILKLAHQNDSNNKDVILLGFFLWRAGLEGLQRSSIGLMRTILYDLLVKRPDILDIVEPNNAINIPAWTNKGLQKALLDAIREGSKSACICLFIDGLDELEGDIESFLHTLKLLYELPGVKVCVSSRELLLFERTLGSAKRMRIHELTRKDISSYASSSVDTAIRQFIEEQEICDISEDQGRKLAWDIALKADGVFLWVTLAIESIRQGIFNDDTYTMLKKRIEELPSEINDLYENLFARIEPVYRRAVARYLRVMFIARSFDRPELISILTLALLDFGDQKIPIRSRDITQATIIQSCKKTRHHIVSRCAGILSLERSKSNMWPESRVTARWERQRQSIKEAYPELAQYDTNEIAFVHRTFFDYLQQHQDMLDSWEGSTTWDAPVALAKACIRRIELLPWTSDLMGKYLLEDVFCTLDCLRAAETESLHANTDVLASLDGAAASVFQRSGLTGQRPDSPQTWYHWAAISMCEKEIWYDTVPSRIQDFAGFCAAYGMTAYIKEIAGAQNSSLDYLLCCAAATKTRDNYSGLRVCIDVLLLLLEMGANPNVSIPWDRSIGFSTPKSKLRTVEMRAAGDNPCPDPPSRPITPWTAALAAFPPAPNQHVKGPVDAYLHLSYLKMLLEHGADVNALSTGYEQFGIPAVEFQIECEEMVEGDFLQGMRVRMEGSARAMLQFLCHGGQPIPAEDVDDESIYGESLVAKCMALNLSLIQDIESILNEKDATRTCKVLEIDIWDSTARNIYFYDCKDTVFGESLFTLPRKVDRFCKVVPDLDETVRPGNDDLIKAVIELGKRYHKDFDLLYKKKTVVFNLDGSSHDLGLND